MQKENSVIKNYILSSKKRILKEDTPNSKSNFLTSEISIHHELLEQNKVLLCLFLSRK